MFLFINDIIDIRNYVFMFFEYGMPLCYYVAFIMKFMDKEIYNAPAYSLSDQADKILHALDDNTYIAINRRTGTLASEQKEIKENEKMKRRVFIEGAAAFTIVACGLEFLLDTKSAK